MTTLGQTLANRENAQKSTGPTSEEGKARVALNGVTHGLCVTEGVVLEKENAEEFAALKEQYLADLNPLNGEQAELAARIVGLVWKCRRATRVEAALWNSGGGTDGDMAVMLGTHGKELDRIIRYGRQAARELAECRKEYRVLQAEYTRQMLSEQTEVDRMVEIRAELTAGLAAMSAKARAAKAGDEPAEQKAAAVQAWNASYDRVVRQARKELEREPVMRFRAGWEFVAADPIGVRMVG